jgi:putative nucleotidyltransferase with HDIG domain
MARRIGLSDSVRQALYEMFERWDGKGLPHARSGNDISAPIRFAQVATQAALFNRLGGAELAFEKIRGLAGSALDPAVADAFALHGPALLRELAEADVWKAVLDAEPRPQRIASEADLDQIARAFADAVDLKSPWMHQHSVGVAGLSEAAARELGLGASVETLVRRAAMFHDLGRVGVPNGIWDKPGPLTTSEWEQVRLHPYHSERILARSTALAEIASIAGMHHERNDGSGYYRQLPAGAVSLPARILAAADCYQAMTQERPYRPALSPEEAAAELLAEAQAGCLDADAVRAVLSAAGQRARAQRVERPAGLTERELEVLRLAARGMTNREMGAQLSISPKTVGHHVQHIYDKIGVSTRAAAALYAMEHKLLQ